MIENFFIRFLRGSGLKGLVSFDRNISEYKGLKIIRPFLTFSKKDLLVINKKTFGFFVQDPTNDNDKFLRIRIRKFLKYMNYEGLDFDKFYSTLKNLSKSDQVIDFFVKKNISDNTKYIIDDKKIILNQSFFNNPDEVILRSLNEIIQRVSKNKNFARGKKVIRLIESLKSSSKSLKLTLSGCIIEKISNSVIIYQEKR